MATHVCKIEARNKLSKDKHVMNQTCGRTFVSIRFENRKQIKFPSKHKTSFWEPTFVASHGFKSKGRCWPTTICTTSQTRDSALVFYSVQTEKQNRTSSVCEIHFFPTPLENKDRHELNIIRNMYQIDESISFLIVRYQSKETKPKFVKIWMPA